MNRRHWLAFSVIAGVLFALNLAETSANRRTGEHPTVSSVELAHDLSMLAVGHPASAEELSQLAADGYSQEAFSDFIHALVRKSEFATVVTDVLKLHGSAFRQVGAMTPLQSAVISGEEVYYTRQPCEPGEIEPVRPWWDLDDTVLVCRDTHRPEVIQTEEGHYCSGLWASTAVDTPCGCGPNLMRCYRGSEDTQGITQGLAHEMSATVSHVIAEDMPLQRLFDSQASFRNGWGQLIYLRAKESLRMVMLLHSKSSLIGETGRRRAAGLNALSPSKASMLAYSPTTTFSTASTLSGSRRRCCSKRCGVPKDN